MVLINQQRLFWTLGIAALLFPKYGHQHVPKTSHRSHRYRLNLNPSTKHHILCYIIFFFLFMSDYLFSILGTVWIPFLTANKFMKTYRKT